MSEKDTPGAEPSTQARCVHCGHSELHNGYSGDVDEHDACTHPMCNCGYYVAEKTLPVPPPASPPPMHDECCEAEQPALPVTGWTACGCAARATQPVPPPASAPPPAIVSAMRICLDKGHRVLFSCLTCAENRVSASALPSELVETLQRVIATWREEAEDTRRAMPQMSGVPYLTAAASRRVYEMCADALSRVLTAHGAS